MEHDYSNDMSDDEAIVEVALKRPNAENAASHLERSIDGGDLSTVRSIAYDLLTALEGRWPK